MSIAGTPRWRVLSRSDLCPAGAPEISQGLQPLGPNANVNQGLKAPGDDLRPCRGENAQHQNWRVGEYLRPARLGRDRRGFLKNMIAKVLDLRGVPVGLEEGHPGPLPGAEWYTRFRGFASPVGMIVVHGFGVCAGGTGHAQESGATVAGDEAAHHDGRHRQRSGRGSGPVLAQADRGSGGGRGSVLEAGFVVGAGVRGIGRAQSQAAGAHPGGGDARVPSGKRMYQTKLVENRGFPLPPGGDFWISSARWAAFGDVTGEGIELQPQMYGQFRCRTLAIVIPDADQSPEQLAGLAEGVPPESQLALRLAESGCHVIVPALIDRTVVLEMAGRG